MASEDEEMVLPGNTGAGLRWFALVCGLAPFFVTYTTTSESTVDGVVTGLVYRNWIAIGGGAIALLSGFVLVAMALRAGSQRAKALGWAAAVVVLGLYQLVGRSGLLF